MSIEIQVHGKDPAALAELIAETMRDGVVVDHEAPIGHFPAVVAAAEREAELRRATWSWLNASRALDRDNDWSGV